MRSLTVSMQQPPRVIHPNGRTRKHKWRWRVVRDFRALVHSLAYCQIQEHFRGQPPMWPAATAQVTIYYGRGQRRQDDDNLIAWLKPAFDGLQDAGVIANDRHLTHLPPIHERDPAKPRVEITTDAGPRKKKK